LYSSHLADSLYSSHLADRLRGFSKLRCEQVFNRVLELMLRVRLTEEVCASDK
jgi:hypothetical protein